MNISNLTASQLRRASNIRRNGATPHGKSRLGHKWTPAQRAKFKATMQARGFHHA